MKSIRKVARLADKRLLSGVSRIDLPNDLSFTSGCLANNGTRSLFLQRTQALQRKIPHEVLAYREGKILPWDNASKTIVVKQSL